MADATDGGQAPASDKPDKQPPSNNTVGNEAPQDNENGEARPKDGSSGEEQSKDTLGGDEAPKTCPEGDEPSKHMPEDDDTGRHDSFIGDFGQPVIPDEGFDPMDLGDETLFPGDDSTNATENKSAVGADESMNDAPRDETTTGEDVAPSGTSDENAPAENRAAENDQEMREAPSEEVTREGSGAPQSGQENGVSTGEAGAKATDQNMTDPPHAEPPTEQSAAPRSSEETTPSAESTVRPSIENPANRTLNLGNSLLGNKPKPTQQQGSGPPRTGFKARKQAKQDDLVKRFQKQQGAGSSGAPSSASEQHKEIENSRPATTELEDESETEKQEEAKRREIYEDYKRKKRAGTISVEEEIKYMRFEAQEKAKQRKLAASREIERTPGPDPEQDGDDGLFVKQTENFSEMFSEDEETTPPKKKRGGKRKAQDEPDVDDDGKKQNAKQPRKKAKANDGAAKKRGNKHPGHDYTDQDFENIIQESERLAKSKRATKAASKKTKQPPKKGGPNMTNMNFFGTNVFEEADQIRDLPNQPGFKAVGGKRNDALKELIASLPEEDRRQGQSDNKALDAAMKDFTGQGSVKPQEGGWLVKGMKTPLKHYQVLGVAFMRRRENSDTEPKGGILADQMGLGKTLQTLANIINGKPPNDKTKVRATLIVAAPALVTQWAAEIEKHCQSAKENKRHGIGNVIHHHASSRMTSNNLDDLLMGADIVLTTYHEIARSYPKAIVPPHLTTAAQKDEWWREYYEENKGILHRIKFHRIVIDEAQAIKNHKGHTSMAVRAIDAKYHWALTGTPIMNSVKEFYPYFKFLREPHTGTYKIFKENFCTPDDPDGIERLTVFLRKFMIRRTHVDTLFNARLLDLPTPKEHTLWLEFNEVERTIYDIVKSRMIARINSLARTEGLEKNYSHVWTMILRLRQLTGHILLIQGTIIDILEREDFEKLNRITAKEDVMSEECARTLVHLRQVLANNASVKEINASLGDAVVTSSEIEPAGVIEIDETQETTLGGKHGLSYHFRKYLDNLIASDKWGAIEDRSQCCSCRQKPYEPVVTSCYHLYCAACIEALQHVAARRGHDTAKCSECGSDFNSVEAVQDFETFLDNKSTQAPSDVGGPTKKKGKKKNDELDDWIGMKGEILPSAKTAACKAQVQNWLAEKADVKIIIYTQFLPIVRILAKVCQTERWGFVKYTGEMSHDARKKAIDEFSNPEGKVRIMLASLRCGGLGLNLTMASRVICFDPWWNESVEQQAFCRVFRIGQTEETRMTRFVVRNSIDAAMMQMKERKQIEIDEVMNSKKTQLDVKHLMRLFGQVSEDEEGRPFIIAETEGGEEGRYRLQDSEDEDAFMGNDI